MLKNLTIFQLPVSVNLKWILYNNEENSKLKSIKSIYLYDNGGRGDNLSLDWFILLSNAFKQNFTDKMKGKKHSTIWKGPPFNVLYPVGYAI